MRLPREVIEATDYFARRKATPNDENLESEIRQWREQSDRHREAYRELEELHGQIDLMREYGLFTLAGESPSLPTATCPVEKATPVEIAAAARTVMRPTHIRLLLLVTLAVTFAGSIALGLHFFARGASRPQTTALWTPYATGRFDKAKRIILADDSSVTLNSNTHIEVSLETQRREVRLVRGDVEFQVARDRSRPFKVLIEDSTVEVLGTAFAVHHERQGELETLVSEGHVRLVTRSGTADLRANQVARVSNGQIHPQRPLSTTEDCRLAWTHDQLCFGKGVSLNRAVAEFNRYNRLQLQLRQSTLDDLPVGGVYDKYDPESFAEALKQFQVGHVEVGPDGSTAHVILLTDQAPDRTRGRAR